MPNVPFPHLFNTIPTVVRWDIYLEHNLYVIDYVISSDKINRNRKWSGTVDELCKYLFVEYIDCMNTFHKLGGQLLSRDIWRFGLIIKYDNGFTITANNEPGFRTVIDKAPLLLEQINGAMQRYNKLKMFF